MDYKALYEDALLDIEIIEKENKQLREENEKMKRRIKGLETTIANFKEKEEKRYKGITFD